MQQPRHISTPTFEGVIFPAESGFTCDGTEERYLTPFPTRIGWRTRPVEVEDGGDWYFQVLYDIESGTFSELYVNGEA